MIHEDFFSEIEDHHKKFIREKKKFGLDDETFVYCPTVPSRGVTKYPPILEKIFELFKKKPQVRKNIAIVSKGKCQTV